MKKYILSLSLILTSSILSAELSAEKNSQVAVEKSIKEGKPKKDDMIETILNKNHHTILLPVKTKTVVNESHTTEPTEKK